MEKCRECGKSSGEIYICPDCSKVICENCAIQTDGEMCCEACADERFIGNS